MCIVQSEPNVTKRAAADVPGRCLYTLASDDFLSEDGNIPCKSTYARGRGLAAARCNCRDRKKGLRASLTDIYRDTKMRSCTARSQELSRNSAAGIFDAAAGMRVT